MPEHRDRKHRERKRERPPESTTEIGELGFSPSSRLGISGSSAMPQIGHDPGSVRTISGCMGHV
jgi:hypothetical protein